jgi:hypothetical protein
MVSLGAIKGFQSIVCPIQFLCFSQIATTYWSGNVDRSSTFLPVPAAGGRPIRNPFRTGNRSTQPLSDIHSAHFIVKSANVPKRP